MARQGGKIEPNIQIFGLGWGAIRVQREAVELEIAIPDLVSKESFVVKLDPETAPLFRMIANRLDEIAGKRKRSA